MNVLRFEAADRAPLPRRPLFHFHIECTRGVVFDVQASCSDDAIAYVNKRSRHRIKTVEMIAEVKTYGRL